MQTDTVIPIRSVHAPSWSEELDGLDRPTPFLALDLEQVIAAYSSLKAALPNFRIHYAMKANPLPEILDALAQRGAGFEVASAAELETLLDRDVRAETVMFSNPVKAPLDIRTAYDCGVPHFAIDSETEIIKLALEAPRSSVYVRIATTGAGSRFPLARRFGVGPMEAIELLKLAHNFGLVPYGCTFHVGSQNTDPRSWDNPIEDCAFVMREFERLHGTRLRMIDIGGGFPAQYAEERVPPLDEFGRFIKRALRCLPYPVELVAEPGRALVANAGVVASSVIGRRRRDAKTWVHLDIGPYNGLMEANSFLGGERNPIGWSPTAADSPATVCTLTGPTCDDGDVLQDEVFLPGDLGTGDRVYIGAAGAYSTSLANNFNGFAPPASFVQKEVSSAEEPAAHDGSKPPWSVPLRSETLGLVAVLLSAILWAVSANVAEGLYVSGLTGLQVAGAETLIAAVCLGAWRHRRRAAHPDPLLSPAQELLLGVSLVLMVATYYTAIELLDVGSAIVLHYSAPVLVVAWSLVRTRQLPQIKVLVSLLLAAMGLVLVTQLVVRGPGDLHPAGVAAALASAAFFALYTLVSDAATKTAGPLEVTTQSFLWASPFALLAVFLGGSPAALLPAGNGVRVLFIGVFGALLGTGLYLWGIDKVHSLKAAITANLEPLVGYALAWLWFSQTLSPLQTLGGVLLLVAVVLLHDSEKSEPDTAPLAHRISHPHDQGSNLQQIATELGG
ncbi:MAG: EamA family transporter [Actinomycetota bacterium]